jgi:hypothetical protein
MSRRNWRQYRASSLSDALRACKDFAHERKNLSVERIADLMSVTADVLYKWLATGRMPANYIPTYEYVCGANFVSDWLANSAGRLVIPMPTGKACKARDVARLQQVLHETVGALMAFYEEKSEAPACQAALMAGMEALGWHHVNVAKTNQPELPL